MKAFTIELTWKKLEIVSLNANPQSTIESYSNSKAFRTNILQTEKQKVEEQSKLTNLLEKILSAFESSSQVSSRVSDGTDDEDDDEKLPKKIDDLLDIVKGLRREIAEFRADQTTIEVKYFGSFWKFNN